MVGIDCFSSGIGQPRFSSEDSCTYVFDWETKHACIDKPASCQLLAGRHLFDLSSLMRFDNMGTSQNVRIQYLQCAEYRQLDVPRNIQNDYQIHVKHVFKTVAFLNHSVRSMYWLPICEEQCFCIFPLIRDLNLNFYKLIGIMYE